jgi:hypothetical protein
MIGAAAATLATEAVRAALALRFADAAGLPLTSPRRFWRPLAAGAGMAAVLIALRLEAVWAAVGAGAVVYAVALLVLGGLKLRRGALPELSL